MKRMMQLNGLVAATVLAMALPAAADTWKLVQLEPFPLDGESASEWQAASWESAYLQAGGFAMGGREDLQPASTEPTLGQTAYRQSYALIGAGVSELSTDFDIGEYCNDFPTGEIDWVATRAAITGSTWYAQAFPLFFERRKPPRIRGGFEAF